MSFQGCPAKKTSTFTEQKATLCDPPHPPGDNTCPPVGYRRQTGENVFKKLPFSKILAYIIYAYSFILCYTLPTDTSPLTEEVTLFKYQLSLVA